MIERRTLLAGGIAALLTPRLATAATGGSIPGNGRLAFDVMLGDRKLGVHQLTFKRNGADLAVDVAVDLAYKLGPITLYRYELRATERWSGSDVIALDSQTNDNGKRFKVTGRREAGGFAVESNTVRRYVAPAAALPATHWNRRELDGPWINPQDGQLVRPGIAPRGVETVTTTGGNRIRARRFAVTGPIQMDLWYDDDLHWAALTAPKDGKFLRYVRQG